MVEFEDKGEHGTVKVGPVSDKKVEPNPVLDMGILCEAVCTLIRICHKAGIKDESNALRDCLNHLSKGFIDESYKVDLLESIQRMEGPGEILLRELLKDLGNLTSEDQLKYKERIRALLK